MRCAHVECLNERNRKVGCILGWVCLGMSRREKSKRKKRQGMEERRERNESFTDPFCIWCGEMQSGKMWKWVWNVFIHTSEWMDFYWEEESKENTEQGMKTGENG